MDNLISVPIDEDLNKVVQVSSNLCEEDHLHLISFLWANVDIFAWLSSDISGVDPEVLVHRLNMDPKYCSVRQKKHPFASDRQKAIQEEVDKLLKVGFLREVYYP